MTTSKRWHGLLSDHATLRVVTDTIVVAVLCVATAQHFDATELRLISLFALYKACTETSLADHTGGRRGRTCIDLLPAALAIGFVLFVLRPATSARIDRKPAEGEDGYRERAVREIARSNA